MGYDEQVIRDCERNEDKRQVWQDNHEVGAREFLADRCSVHEYILEDDRVQLSATFCAALNQTIKMCQKNKWATIHTADLADADALGILMMEFVRKLANEGADEAGEEYANSFENEGDYPC